MRIWAMSPFDYDSYKEYVNTRIAGMPKNGRGEFRKIAEHLGVHSTLISHIFRGDTELTLEQAVSLAKYWGLNDFECEYFLNLVQRSRAGTPALRTVIDRRLDQQREQAAQISKRISPQRILDEKDKALFYSEWYYSGIRLLSSVPGFQDTDSIAVKLGLSKTAIHRAVEFLLETGLCKMVDGKLQHAVQTTHVPADSPLASRHHKNWRLKAMERYPNLGPSELAFTMPVTLSLADAKKVRKMIVNFIQDIDKVFDSSPSEKLSCLNIDWIDVD